MAIVQHHDLKGHIARILRLKAKILEKDIAPSEESAQKAADLKARAELLKAGLSLDGTLGVSLENLSEEKAYEQLVGLYFR